jgi:hypothetical protein
VFPSQNTKQVCTPIVSLSFDAYVDIFFISVDSNETIEEQKIRMRKYFLACQPVFEKLYTELAASQPPNPADFLSLV